MFDLNAVAKRFHKSVALHPITLHVAPGETTVFIGPSGCGKSTLLRLMVGLLRPDGGTIAFDGKLVDRGDLPRIRRRLGYVIQDGGLFPHLTARGNAALMARHLRWSREKIETRMTELAELTRLPVAMLDRFPAELSGGQRQRMALMRALMLDPDVLLLDEPLGALDPMVRFDLQNDLIDIFHRLHKTVVLVTHDMGEAAFFADTILLLREGAVVQQGTIDDLLHRPADPFVTRFLKAQRVTQTAETAS